MLLKAKRQVPSVRARGHRRVLLQVALLAVAALQMAFSQQSQPKLDFRWRHDMSFTQMIEASSVIIVGQVRSLQYVGASIQAVDDTGYQGRWQLVRVRTTVEHLLKGAADDRLVCFYFYVSLGPTSGDWNALHAGDRCVFFLTTEHGTPRAIRDHWRSCIEIGTGRHFKLPLTEENSIEERIGALLLTPGDGLVPERVHRLISQSVTLGEEWLGCCRTRELLVSLSHHRSEDVRAAAVDQLKIRSYDSDDCACPELR